MTMTIFLPRDARVVCISNHVSVAAMSSNARDREYICSKGKLL